MRTRTAVVVALGLLMASWLASGHALAAGAKAVAKAGAKQKTAASAPHKLILIAGKPSHPPGMHEFHAGMMLLHKRLAKVKGLDAAIYFDGWPSKMVDGKPADDPAAFDGASAVFIYSDGGPRHPAIQGDHLEFLKGLAKKGVNLGFAHYGVEIPADNGGKEFKEWIGGHYQDKLSVNPIWKAEYSTFPKHPVAAGVKPFSIEDEWYFNIQFADDMKGVTPILVATPSDAVRDGPYVYPKGPYPHIQAAKGRKETMMWVFQRPDGGRGLGFTGGHFHKNWQNDDFRKVVLNGLVWLAGVPVPTQGIVSDPVSDDELKENLDLKPAKKADVKPETKPEPKSESVKPAR